MLGPAPKAVPASPRSGGNKANGTPVAAPAPAASKMDSPTNMGKSGSRVVSSARGNGTDRSSRSDVGAGRVERSEGADVAPSAAKEPTGSGGAGAADPSQILKFHSAVRWCKPWAEIEGSLGDASLAAAVRWQDPKNGNTALHIASQNGHLDLVQRLCSAGAPANVQNGKG